jgi:hypothetical protein
MNIGRAPASDSGATPDSPSAKTLSIADKRAGLRVQSVA